jgi:O-acetyl-ADP-ribose deacetylase (regulator of RNase III)
VAENGGIDVAIAKYGTSSIRRERKPVGKPKELLE